jgi:CMP-2-keto-3-deoxyoctulosonic acid synthetase
MLGVRHTSRIVWRRRHARCHYTGYLIVADDAIRLAGDERATGIHAVLSIPQTAIGAARVGQLPEEQVVGEQAVVIELADDDPIYVRPVTTGPLDLDELARRLSPTSAGATRARARL